ECVSIREQTQVAIDLPIIRIQLPQRDGHFESSQQWTKRRPIRNDDIHAATLLVLEHRCVRSKSQRHEPHAGYATLIQVFGELVPLNPWRANNLKRRVSAATNRNVGC